MTTSGRGESRLRQAFGSAFKYQVAFSRIMPGTSHDSRAGSSWFKSASGTVSVSPSRGCPGAKRYLSGSFAPAMSMNSGNCSSVTAAAAWRIKASRVRNSRRGSATSTSRHQRSNAAVVQIASGIRSA